MVPNGLFPEGGEYRLTAELPLPRLLMVSALRLREWDFPELRAPYWRLYWNAELGSRVRFPSYGEEAVGPDRLLVIPSGVSFAGIFGGEVGHLAIHFQIEAQLGENAKPCYTLCLGEEGKNAMSSLLQRLRYMHETTDARPAFFAATAAVSAVLAVVPPGDWLRPECDPVVMAARAVIDAAFPHAVENRRLAEASRLSENQLIRRFRIATGTTPRDYLQTKRIREAVALMHRMELSLDTIAERTGFTDRFHFSRIFTRRTGSSPAVFRRGLRRAGG